MSIESSFGKFSAKKPEPKKIVLGPGREISVSPKEEEEHKKLEARQSMLRPETHEAEETTPGRTLEELTEEEKELLAEMVPDEQMRINLPPDVVEMFLRNKKEEEEKREAA